MNWFNYVFKKKENVVSGELEYNKKTTVVVRKDLEDYFLKLKAEQLEEKNKEKEELYKKRLQFANKVKDAIPKELQEFVQPYSYYKSLIVIPYLETEIFAEVMYEPFIVFYLNVPKSIKNWSDDINKRYYNINDLLKEIIKDREIYTK